MCVAGTRTRAWYLCLRYTNFNILCILSDIKMPTKQRSKRPHQDISQYKKGYDAVKDGMSLRKAGEKFGVNYVSLKRYIEKRDNATARGEAKEVEMGFVAHNRVFSDDQEKEICKYLIRCAKIGCLLSTKEIKGLAYQLAVRSDLPRPTRWDEIKTTGGDWYIFFMKRNKEVSSKDEAGSTRVVSWNKLSAEGFYNNLHFEINRHKFKAKDIYTVDHLSVATGQKLDTLIGGKIQTDSLNQIEKRRIVSVVLAANAEGRVLAPMFILPRESCKDSFLRDGPEGASEAVNSSGVMDEDIFLEYLKHFKEHVKASRTRKVVIVLDNHSAHTSQEALEYCTKNGIIMVQFPMHWSHKLHPFECSIYRAFKEELVSTRNSWMRDNPGKPLSIYNIPRIVAAAMPVALSETNIREGFKLTGIHPFNRNAYTNEELLESLQCNNLCFNESPSR